jgi:hypothetical protein
MQSIYFIFQIVKKLWGLVFCFISLNVYKKLDAEKKEREREKRKRKRKKKEKEKN